MVVVYKLSLSFVFNSQALFLSYSCLVRFWVLVVVMRRSRSGGDDDFSGGGGLICVDAG